MGRKSRRGLVQPLIEKLDVGLVSLILAKSGASWKVEWCGGEIMSEVWRSTDSTVFGG